MVQFGYKTEAIRIHKQFVFKVSKIIIQFVNIYRDQNVFEYRILYYKMLSNIRRTKISLLGLKNQEISKISNIRQTKMFWKFI